MGCGDKRFDVDSPFTAGRSSPAISFRPKPARAAAALALYLTLAACTTAPQTIIVHQPVAPPISAALTTCTPEPPKPPRTASDVAYAQWGAAAVYAGRDCRNVLGKLVSVLDSWAASIKADGRASNP